MTRRCHSEHFFFVIPSGSEESSVEVLWSSTGLGWRTSPYGPFPSKGEGDLTLPASQTSLSFNKERDVSVKPKQGEVDASLCSA